MSDTVSLPEALPIAAPDTAQTDPRDQFLRLYLAPSTTVLLPIQQLSEVLNIPTPQIVPMPHMPPWVMGVYNWRGEILWMVDFGHLCGQPPWYEQATHRSVHAAVVLQVSQPIGTVRNPTLGLVVDRVEDIEWFDPQEIQSVAAAAIDSALAPLLSGYWRKREEEILAVLSGEAIVAAMPKS